MPKTIKPVKRIKRKELKEDKLVTTFFQARDYFEKHQGNIIKIGGAAVLVVALAAFWFISKSRAEHQASYELSMAILAAQAGNPAAVSDQFSQIADRYAGTTAGDEALFYVAQMKFLADEPEEALKAFDDFLSKGRKGTYLYAASLAGKAATLEDLGRFEEAAQTYLAAASVNPDRLGFASPEFHLDAARCYRLAGKEDKAQEQYELVLSRYGETPFAQQAQKEMKRVENDLKF